MIPEPDESISMLHHVRSVLGVIRRGFESEHPARLKLATHLATAQGEITEVLSKLESEPDRRN